MSGYKRATITINQDEYDRLRESDLKLRALPEVLSQDYTKLIEKSNQTLQNHLMKMQGRQASLEKILSGMDHYVRELETSTARRMVEFEQQAAAEAQNYAGCLWNSFTQVIQQQASDFNSEIAATHQVFQDELAQYSRRVRRMAEDQDSKRALAAEWLNTAELFSQFIDQNYPHDVFTPGRYDQLARQMEQARGNLEIGLSEAVIVTSQQLYFSFSDLRVDLERMQHEWNLLLRSASEAVGQVLAMAHESMVVPAVDLDGNPLSFDIQVDHWSEGRLTLLIDELSYIKEMLECEVGLPDSETLQRWLELDLPVYFQALQDIVLDARVTALNSQLRINIADLVVRALQDQGFALDTSNYEAADQRSAYGARLSNLEGSEVLVQVEPAGREIGQNELHVQSLDREERTEHELQQRWFEVSRSLSRYGLEVGQYIREEGSAYQVPGQQPDRKRLARTGQQNNPTKNNSAR